MNYLKEMKSIQDHILVFLDSDEEDSQNFDDLSKLLIFQLNDHDIQKLESILHLISKIVDNHHRGPFFFEKIEKIINQLKDQIKQTFSNIQIFNFFKDNKRMILLLIKEDILTFDSEILTNVAKYKDYFNIEISKLNENCITIEIPDNYEEKRLKGENDSYLCELIRNDSVEEFIAYHNKALFSLSMTIEDSIYETNSFLENKSTKLVEYTVFHGSTQIFQYLIHNNVELDSSLFLYAIHSQNPEIIHLLENNIYLNYENYQECLKESIKCHHNNFANYFQDNFISEVDNHSKCFMNEIYSGFQFYNFQYIPIELKDPFCFFYAVEFNYYMLVEYYLNIYGLNINEKIV